MELLCTMNSPELGCRALDAFAAAGHSIPRAGIPWCGAWHCRAGSSPKLCPAATLERGPGSGGTQGSAVPELLSTGGQAVKGWQHQSSPVPAATHRTESFPCFPPVSVTSHSPESTSPASPAGLVPPPCLSHRSCFGSQPWCTSLSLPLSVFPVPPACPPLHGLRCLSDVGRFSPCQEHPQCQHSHTVPGVPHPCVPAPACSHPGAR